MNNLQVTAILSCLLYKHEKYHIFTHSLESSNHSKLKPYKKLTTYKDYMLSKSSKVKAIQVLNYMKWKSYTLPLINPLGKFTL